MRSSITSDFVYWQSNQNECFYATVHDDGKGLCLSTSRKSDLKTVTIVQMPLKEIRKLQEFLNINFGEWKW